MSQDKIIFVNDGIFESKMGISRYITEVQGNDVLFGRGSGSNDHTGNVKFRKYVAARKAEYIGTNHRKTKLRIAQDIVHTVLDVDKGRFLRRIDDDEAVELGLMRRADCTRNNQSTGLSSNKTFYEVVDENMAMEKTKQALRQNAVQLRAIIDEEWSSANKHRFPQREEVVNDEPSSLGSNSVVQKCKRNTKKRTKMEDVSCPEPIPSLCAAALSLLHEYYNSGSSRTLQNDDATSDDFEPLPLSTIKQGSYESRFATKSESDESLIVSPTSMYAKPAYGNYETSTTWYPNQATAQHYYCQYHPTFMSKSVDFERENSCARDQYTNMSHDSQIKRQRCYQQQATVRATASSYDRVNDERQQPERISSTRVEEQNRTTQTIAREVIARRVESVSSNRGDSCDATMDDCMESFSNLSVAHGSSRRRFNETEQTQNIIPVDDTDLRCQKISSEIVNRNTKANTVKSPIEAMMESIESNAFSVFMFESMDSFDILDCCSLSIRRVSSNNDDDFSFRNASRHSSSSSSCMVKCL